MKAIVGVIFLVFVVLIAMTAIDMGTTYVSSAIFTNPEVSLSANETIVYVNITFTGQIEKPGSYTIPKGTYLKDAFTAAGGLTSEADSDCYNSYFEIEDDISIYIPKLTEDEKISINEAELEELTTLTGIGKTIGGRIIKFRETYGDFEYLEQLMEVEGIGKTIFNNIKDNICL